MKVKVEDEEKKYGWLLAVIVGVVLVEMTVVTILVGEGKDIGETEGEKGKCFGCYRNEEVCQIKTIDRRGGGCVRREGDEECLGERAGTFGWRYCY